MLSERQQQIIEESIKLIDKKGIQGFTIKNLSKEIGFSEPAIYRHFENKFEILNTILESFRFSIIQNEKIIADTSIEPQQRLEAFFTKIFETFTHNPAITSVIFSEEIFQNEKTLLDKINGIQEANETLIRGLMKEMQAKGMIKNAADIETILLIIFGSLRLLVKKWKYANYNFNLIEKGNHLFKTIINLIQ